MRFAGRTVDVRLGMRGHPEPPSGWGLLLHAADGSRGRTLDLTQTHGWVAQRSSGVSSHVDVVLTSALSHQAAQRFEARTKCGCVTLNLASVRTVTPGVYDTVWLAPPADRGNAVVSAHLHAAAAALRPTGQAWVLLEESRGAKRYEGWVRERFERVELAGKRAGYRLLHAEHPHPLGVHVPPQEFDTPWGTMRAYPGAWSAGKLDPGAAFLLKVLDADQAVWSGLKVWDLGCGFGPLASFAEQAGAQVIASDDEADAIESCRLNAPDARVLHAAGDACLAADETFDVVLLNPPHHVGAGVRRDVGRELVQTAWRRVKPGGVFWVVSNTAVPYERDVPCVVSDSVQSDDGRFTVLRWQRPA